MIEKREFYHGAAIVRVLEDERCVSLRKKELLGHVLNDQTFVFLKYTTKGRSPWIFTFDQEDVDRCYRMLNEYSRVVLGLICGGDGVCALDWTDARKLLDHKPGTISVKRKHNESYGVSGSIAKLQRKIPVGSWPILLFQNI